MLYKDLLIKFSSEEKIIDYYIQIRYKGVPQCPHCGSTKKICHRRDTPKRFQCNFCNNSFSIFKNTIFEKSTTPLIDWFYAINLFLNSVKGISSNHLKKEIGVTLKCAWLMLKKIRIAMSNSDHEDIFQGIVELDETYVGGKPRRKLNPSPMFRTNYDQYTYKTPVFGAYERNTGRLRAKVLHYDDLGRRLSSEQLEQAFNELCKDKVIAITDDYRGYTFLKKDAYKDYSHHIVNHNNKEYSKGNGIHINTIESLWKLLKNGFYRTYHKISLKYLQSYVDEFCFRVSNSKNPDIFDTLISQTILIKEYG